MKYYLLTLLIMGVSRLVSMQMQRRFAEFSQLRIPYSGREVAQMMLRDAGVNNVGVTSVRGQLTDHYNPANKTVNLSEAVFEQHNVAAAAVAAHECGHAVQDHANYPFLRMRSKLVPLVNFSNVALQWVLMAGLIMASMGTTKVLLLGIILFAITTLFAIITLPVEFDASFRALKWMKASGLTGGAEHSSAQKALFWAAMTYTVGAIGSIGQLFYFIMQYLNSQRRD